MLEGIAVYTAHYMRDDIIEKTVKAMSVASQAIDIPVIHIIIDDGSPDITTLGELYQYQHKNYSLNIVAQEEHCGKHGYWKTITNALKEVEKTGYRWTLSLDDDHVMHPNGLKILMDIVYGLPKNSLLCFRMEKDRFFEGSRWPYMPGQLIDGGNVIERDCWEKIGWHINEPKPRPRIGSGVWRQVSYRMLDAIKDARILFLNNSIITHEGDSAETSLMNPDDRAKVSLHSIRLIDEVEEPTTIIDPYVGWKGTSDKKMLIHLNDGMGNGIQKVIALLQGTAKFGYGSVDVLNRLHGTQTDVLWNILQKKFGGKVLKQRPTDIIYDVELGGVVNMFHNMPGEVNKIAHFLAIKDCYIDKPERIVRDFLPIRWEDFSKINTPSYDVVICNGSYNENGLWLRKKYQKWDVVAEMLKSHGLAVASTGLPSEYVYGTEDAIYDDIAEVFALVNNCRLLVTNDTGLYHFANMIGKDNVVVFTASSIAKNYHPIFHRFSTVIRSDVCPEPCQEPSGKRSPRWNECITWDCCYFDPEIIVKEVLKHV